MYARLIVCGLPRMPRRPYRVISMTNWHVPCSKVCPRLICLMRVAGQAGRVSNIPGAVGIDLSPEMLAAGGVVSVVAGDIREMPFASGQFDMVWCRLVLGYLRDPFSAYREFCRVCMPGGYVFVTDFHPDATRAGHRRTFNDQAGAVHEIENYEHTNHVELALQAGLEVNSLDP